MSDKDKEALLAIFKEGLSKPFLWQIFKMRSDYRKILKQQ